MLLNISILFYTVCIGTCVDSLRSIQVYPIYCPYWKSKNIIQIGNVFIAGGCHHILEIWNVIEVHHLMVWCWHVFWRPSWMDRDKKRRSLAVTVNECISVWLELALLAKCHHLIRLLGSLLLLLWWHPGRNHLCSGRPCVAVHVKIILLFHGVGCYLLKGFHHC